MEPAAPEHTRASLKGTKSTTVSYNDKEESETAPNGKLNVFAGIPQFIREIIDSQIIAESLRIEGKDQAERRADYGEYKLNLYTR